MPKAKSREWTGGEHQSLVQKQDGSFEIADVSPGSYVLTAMWFDDGKPHSARFPIDVGNADVGRRLGGHHARYRHQRADHLGRYAKPEAGRAFDNAGVAGFHV